jgi:hypothetical protein
MKAALPCRSPGQAACLIRVEAQVFIGHVPAVALRACTFRAERAVGTQTTSSKPRCLLLVSPEHTQQRYEVSRLLADILL